MNHNLFTITSVCPPMPKSPQRWHQNWFSNYQFMDKPLPVALKNGQVIYFKTVENFYQAMKTDNEQDWITISQVSAPASKPLGKKVIYRPNYSDEMAILTMEFAIRYKFAPGTTWYTALMATGDEELIEWNNWWDKRWGRIIQSKQGTNWLGLILMKLRAEYNGQDVSDLNIIKLGSTLYAT